MEKVIFFDVDGVLIHGYHYHEELRHCWDEKIENDLGINREKFCSLFFSPLWGEIITGKRDLKESLDEFLPTIGFSGQSEYLIEYWLENDSKINGELLSFIKKLSTDKDIRLFIATNQEHNRANYLMEKCGFSKYFEDIFHSAKIGFTKTQPEYFEAVDKLIGIQNTKPILFDDTPKVVKAAKEHGWDAYEFYDLSSLKQSDFISAKINKIEGV